MCMNYDIFGRMTNLYRSYSFVHESAPWNSRYVDEENQWRGALVHGSQRATPRLQAQMEALAYSNPRDVLIAVTSLVYERHHHHHHHHRPQKNTNGSIWFGYIWIVSSVHIDMNFSNHPFVSVTSMVPSGKTFTFDAGPNSWGGSGSGINFWAVSSQDRAEIDEDVMFSKAKACMCLWVHIRKCMVYLQ